MFVLCGYACIGGEVDEVRCGGCGRRTATIVPFKSLAIAMTREAQEQACFYASESTSEKEREKRHEAFPEEERFSFSF